MFLLLIEDNMADRMLMSEAFKNASLANELHCVEDGDVALEYLNKVCIDPEVKVPNVILSDMTLPGKSGHEVLADVKSNERLKNIPFVISSGTLSAKEISLSYQLGASAHVAKPSSMDQYYEFAEAVIFMWKSTVLPDN